MLFFNELFKELLLKKKIQIWLSLVTEMLSSFVLSHMYNTVSVSLCMFEQTEWFPLVSLRCTKPTGHCFQHAGTITSLLLIASFPLVHADTAVITLYIKHPSSRQWWHYDEHAQVDLSTSLCFVVLNAASLQSNTLSRQVTPAGFTQE